jgi:hypothetical protein
MLPSRCDGMAKIAYCLLVDASSCLAGRNTCCSRCGWKPCWFGHVCGLTHSGVGQRHAQIGGCYSALTYSAWWQPWRSRRCSLPWGTSRPTVAGSCVRTRATSTEHAAHEAAPAHAPHPSMRLIWPGPQRDRSAAHCLCGTGPAPASACPRLRCRGCCAWLYWPGLVLTRLADGFCRTCMAHARAGRLGWVKVVLRSMRRNSFAAYDVGMFRRTTGPHMT